jgi:hypothetical protein
MALVLAFGLWLVHLGGFGYGAGWIDAALALFVGAAVLGGFGGQAPRRARQRAARLVAEGRVGDPELRRLLGDRPALLASYGSTALMLASEGWMQRLRAATLAAEARVEDAELRRLLNDRRAQLANYGSALLVVAILVLMVWKPGGPG